MEAGLAPDWKGLLVDAFGGFKLTEKISSGLVSFYLNGLLLPGLKKTRASVSTGFS